MARWSSTSTVTLPDGTRVAGTVPGAYGDRLVRVVYSRLGAKHRLRAWAQLLALVVAAHEDRDWSAATVGRGKTARHAVAAVARRSPADAARPAGRRSSRSTAAGLESPLPLRAQDVRRLRGQRCRGSPVAASTVKAEGEWRRSYQGREIGEFADPEHLRVWGGPPAGRAAGRPRARRPGLVPRRARCSGSSPGPSGSRCSPTSGS